jgi:peptidoglycan hydrolase CwlO-like protein
MMALVIVLFLGFAGMFVAVGQMMIDSLRDKQASYQDLRDQVKDQSNKIDTLTDQITRLTQNLQNQQKPAQ